MFNLTRKNLIILAVTFFIIVIAIFSLPALRSPFLSTVKNPLIVFTMFRRELGAYLFYHRNYVQKERLEKEVDFLKTKLNAQEEQELENARLKELLSLKTKSAFKVISARVIARSPDSWSSAVTIDKGKDSGIRVGMGVITYLGLAGRVVEVSASTSKILLINDPSLGVSAIVERSRQEGLVSGTLGVNLIMRYFPEGSDIKIDDNIVTSGLNEVYPKAIIIGRVIDIGKEFSGLRSYAIIKPAVNLASLEEVLIVFP